MLGVHCVFCKFWKPAPVDLCQLKSMCACGDFLSVCEYVHVYACTWVYLYNSVCACVRAWGYLCVSLCVVVGMSVCVRLCLPVCACVCVSMYVCRSACVCVVVFAVCADAFYVSFFVWRQVCAAWRLVCKDIRIFSDDSLVQR